MCNLDYSVSYATIVRDKSQASSTQNWTVNTYLPFATISGARFKELTYSITVFGQTQYMTAVLRVPNITQFSRYNLTTEKYYNSQFTVTADYNSTGQLEIAIVRDCFKTDWVMGTRLLVEYSDLPFFSITVYYLKLFY